MTSSSADLNVAQLWQRDGCVTIPGLLSTDRAARLAAIAEPGNPCQGDY